MWLRTSGWWRACQSYGAHTADHARAICSKDGDLLCVSYIHKTRLPSFETKSHCIDQAGLETKIPCLSFSPVAITVQASPNWTVF